MCLQLYLREFSEAAAQRRVAQVGIAAGSATWTQAPKFSGAATCGYDVTTNLQMEVNINK